MNLFVLKGTIGSLNKDHDETEHNVMMVVFVCKVVTIGKICNLQNDYKLHIMINLFEIVGASHSK